TIVDNQCEVRLAGCFQAGGDAGGPESQGGGNGHGATPCRLRPAASGRPSAIFMDCTAPPAVPLVRLSMTQVTITRPVCSSNASCMTAWFDPWTDLVDGHWPSGSRCTNGSSS